MKDLHYLDNLFDAVQALNDMLDLYPDRQSAAVLAAHNILVTYYNAEIYDGAPDAWGEDRPMPVLEVR